ncbi:MAG TPA: alpha/beta hydrolase [Caulobacteraceae bacterium]|nr:alpha/beta hydrolase [Caulobacteraceae bacterium]
MDDIGHDLPRDLGAATTEPRQRYVTLPAPSGPGEMAFLDYGPPERAPDLVFLHANGFNARAYRTILSPLAGALRILAPDQRGHGATRLATDRPRTSWLDLKDDLLAFLDAMQIGRVALAGHSMGGTASLLAAAEAPGRVRALALLDPVIRPLTPVQFSPEQVGASGMVQGATKRRRVFPSRAVAVEGYRGRGAFRTWTEAQLTDYVEAGFLDLPDGTVTLACTPEWEVSNYVNQDHDSWAAFEATRCPIHILRAERESPGRLDEGLERLEATGRIRIETVPDTTHFLPMERPDLVRAAILEAVAAP